MVKPLNEFGGWLTFFYITLWLRIILSLGLGLMLILERMGVGRTPTPSAIIWVSIVYFLIVLLVVINILRIMKKDDSSAPDKMLCLIYLYICLLIIYWGVESFVKHLVHYPITFVNFWADIVWGTSFMQYVMNSKRVKAYYGVNATVIIREHLGPVLINLLPNCWKRNTDAQS